MARLSDEKEIGMETTVLSAHIAQPLAAKVDRMAVQLKRSPDWIVEQALADWLAREEEYDRLTREGLASARAGNVVEHSVVLAWAEGLTAEPDVQS